ncbi:MAG: AAA family ATPase [Desulfobulbaceae bacterium]
MQEEQHITPRPPFDHALFFPDSGQRSILEALKNAVADSASLITCIGEEGYGKTTLCKTLEKELSESHLLISFPYSVESFDYVLQIIALKLQLDFSTEDNTLGSGQLLTEISRALHEQGKQLLILFDEAEKLYLATLERLRKMIDLINEDGVLLQIILFGRTGLQAHIEQLSLCTFKDTRELHLTLPPLTEEETFQYLNFCMRESPGLEGKDIFSREVAAKILAMSHGNFRKINSLAEDSLQSSSSNGDNTSFMVLLEHVRDADDPSVEAPSAYRLPLLFMQKKTALGVGALLVALFLFVFVNKEAKEPAPLSRPEATQLIPQSTLQQILPDQKDMVVAPAPPAPLEATEPVAREDAGAEPVQPVPVAVPEVTENPVVEPAKPALVATQPPVTEQVQSESTVKQASVEITPLVEKKSSELQVLTADKTPLKNTIPLLSPEPFTKNKELLKSRKELKSDITRQIPQKSLAAGDRWLAGKNNDRFTLQLMVLTADQAGKKLRAIVRDEGNQKGPGDFIVLRKSTAPTTFLLFYGEYSTLAAARNARNALPQSLQKYSPYPVSIKQAVEKSRK